MSAATLVAVGCCVLDGEVDMDGVAVNPRDASFRSARLLFETLRRLAAVRAATARRNPVLLLRTLPVAGLPCSCPSPF